MSSFSAPASGFCFASPLSASMLALAMEHIGDSYEWELRSLLEKHIGPEAGRIALSILDGKDFSGEPSLNIRLEFPEPPGNNEFDALRSVVREFRFWLDEQNDERFPYITVETQGEDFEQPDSHASA